MNQSKLIKTEGLVIRVVDCSDGDELYTVLTKDAGRLVIKAKPPLKGLGIYELRIAVGFYMEFVLSRRGNLCWIRESHLKEAFFNNQWYPVRHALVEYIFDVAYALSDDGQECGDILSLACNSIYMLNYNKEFPIDLVKATFDLRAMSDAGYMPDISPCRHCKKLDGDLYLDVMEGSIICSSCLRKKSKELPYIDPNDMDYHAPTKILCPINFDVICAMNYIIKAPMPKLFSFKLEDEECIDLLERAAKTFLINHLERDFDTMKFYYELRDYWKKQDAKKNKSENT